MNIPHSYVDGHSRSEIYEPLMNTPELLETYFNQPIDLDLDFLSPAGKRDISTLDYSATASVLPDHSFSSQKRQKASLTSQLQYPYLLEDDKFIHQEAMDIPFTNEKLHSFPPITDDLFEVDFHDHMFDPFQHSKHHNSGAIALNSIDKFHSFTSIKDDSFDNTFHDHTSYAFQNPKHCKDDTKMLQLSKDSQEEIISYGFHHPFRGPPSKLSDEKLKVGTSDSRAEHLHMGFGFNGVEGEALFNQLSSSNPELQPSRILGMTLYTIQNMDYELPKIGLVEIENHRSLGEAMNSWFQVLTQKVQINLQSLSIPQGEKDVIWPKLLFAIKGANVKLTTSFLVCLKFSYLKDPLELHDLYSSGWKFISDIMDGWGTINLKEVLKTEFGSLSKQNQQLNSSFLLSYMLTLQSKAPISLMTLWKICGSWQNQLPNQEDRFKPELTFQDFSKNVLAGVIQAACLTKNSGQKPQIGLNPNTSSGEMINQTQKQTHTAELLDNPHRYQHPHVSSNHRKVDRAILQAQSVGESMIKSSGFNQLPDKWFLDLSVKVKNKANQVYPLSSFHFTEKDLEWAIKTTQNYITPAFLGIIILLHPKITDPVERNMLALNGWSFLKHYMEGWKGYSLEEAVQLSLPKITEFYKHPKPSVLLRYLMRINVNCTTRIPTSMLWGLWLAWVEWDGCIVTNKIYIASYKSFRQLLDQEAMINLSRPSLPMLG